MGFDSALADRITAIVLFALGVAMLAGGYSMDRLEFRQIHPASIPGLVPMILGATMMVCAVSLFVGAIKRSREESAIAREAGADVSDGGASWGRLATTAVLSGFYALILVGRVPFFAATAVYVGVFILCFTWPTGGTTTHKLRAVIVALIFALATAAAISTLFRYGFLVRLP